MLISAAVCPHPPLLVAGIGPEDDDQLDALRESCWSALDALRITSPDALVVVGAGASTQDDAPRAASLAAYGVDRLVALPGATPAAGDLPLSVCVGAWLLEKDGWTGSVSAATVAEDAAPTNCVRLGESIAGRADRVALLVMADGSARRSDTAPRTFHPRAAEYDELVAQALLSGDPQQILALDSGLAVEVAAGGLSPLRVLAGAAAEAVFDAELLYDAAPYGVGYVVGVWERHG